MKTCFKLGLGDASDAIFGSASASPETANNNGKAASNDAHFIASLQLLMTRLFQL